MSGNIKRQLKGPPNAKLSTSSPISDKLISNTFVLLVKHGHGQSHHYGSTANVSEFLYTNCSTTLIFLIYTNCSTTLIFLMWRHDRWTLYERYWLKISEISPLSWWSKLIQNAPFAIKLSRLCTNNYVTFRLYKYWLLWRWIRSYTWLYVAPEKYVLTELARSIRLFREWHITTYSPTPKVYICFIIYYQLNY